MSSLFTTPLLPPPEGVESDFSHPDNIIAWTIGLIASTLPLCVFVGVLRAYTKLHILGTHGPDDYFALLALIFACIQQACCLAASKYGLGWHAWDIPLPYVKPYTTYFTTAFLFHVSSICATKVSIILFFLRFMPRKLDRQIVYTCSAFTIVYTIGIILSVILGCKPALTAWDPTIEGGSCINQTPIYIAMISLNVMTDLYILVVPLPILYRLRLPLSQKIGLYITFLAGGFIIIITIIWLIKTLRLADPSQSADYTYYVAIITHWAIVETNLGILVACFPALKPLLVRILPATIYSSSGGNSRSGRSKMFRHPLRTFGGGGGERPGNGQGFDSNDSGGHNLVSVTTKAFGEEQEQDHGNYHETNESQENIFKSSKGIMKQTDVAVEYDDSSSLERAERNVRHSSSP